MGVAIAEFQSLGVELRSQDFKYNCQYRSEFHLRQVLIVEVTVHQVHVLYYNIVFKTYAANISEQLV